MVAENGSIERLTVAHVDPQKVRWAHELAEQYPPDPHAQYGVPNVIRTQQAEFFTEIPAELLQEATADTPELYDILQELGLKSSMCVPLVARDRALGAITFVSAESGRRYEESDLATAQDLARRAAISVDNAEAVPRSRRLAPPRAGVPRGRRRRFRCGADRTGVHGTRTSAMCG